MKVSAEQFDALCRLRFSVFFQRAWSELDPAPYSHNWHIDCISEYLEYVREGDIKRLIINVPPRTGKTLLTNVAFPAWVMGKDPTQSVIGVSYGQRLSGKIAYKQRTLMETEWFKELFPDCQLDPNYSGRESFLTTKKGGRFSSSVGGTLTGEGADYIIIDDPVNPDEALSDVKRINANEWLDQTVFSRLNDPENGRIVMIMQRLHSNDPTGHFLELGGWEHLKLPAYTKSKVFVDRTSKKFEYEGYLHPTRLSEDTLDTLKQSLGTYAYAGQYLQEPVPLGGGEFKTDWINYYASQSFDPKGSNIYILVDPATSKKKTSDYTAMVVVALAPDQNYYLIDGIKERLNPTERINKLFELHKKWNAKTNRPPKVGYEQYGMMSDVHYIKEKQAELNYRFQIIEVKSGMNKEERIRRLVPLMEAGQYWLPNDMYIKNAKGLLENFINGIVEEEMLLFPYAKHDDFLDAMAMLFDIPHSFPKLGNVSVTDGLNWGDESYSVLDM